MHPEIKKFWETSGHSILIDVLEDDLWTFYWVLMKGERQVGFAGKIDRQPPGRKKDPPPCSIYFLGNKEYSEETMLRIVR